VSAPLTLYREHGRRVSEELAAWEMAGEVAKIAETASGQRREALQAAAEGQREVARQHHDAVRVLRAQLADGGWRPPVGYAGRPDGQESR
jgi:hypothetical protein